MKKYCVLGLLLAFAPAAFAGFSTTAAGPFDSNGSSGDPLNGTFTYDYTGADFYVGDIVFSGDVTSGDIGSYKSELGLMVTDPNGVSAYISGFVSGTTWTGTETIGPLAFSGGGEIIAGTAGTYTFGFYETYNDSGDDVDAIWTNISVELQDGTPPVPQYLSDYAAATLLPGDSIMDNNGNYEDNLDRGNGFGEDGSSDAVYAVDWAGGDFTANLEFIDEDGDIDLFLWGDNEATDLLDSSAGVTDIETVEALDLAAGTYYLVVDGWNGSTNDFTLSVVPEPASLALLAIGGIALIRRK